MPLLCLEAWKRENITLFQKSNLRVCRGVSRFEPLTAWMPQTHWPILQLLVADHHSYTSSTASLAAHPAFLDSRKLGGSTQDYPYNAPQCSSCLWIPWATWALRVHCVRRPVLGTLGRNYSSTSSTGFWALGIQARAPHRNLWRSCHPSISCSRRRKRAAEVTENYLYQGGWMTADGGHTLSLEHIAQQHLPYRAFQVLTNYILSKATTLLWVWSHRVCFHTENTKFG